MKHFIATGIGSCILLILVLFSFCVLFYPKIAAAMLLLCVAYVLGWAVLEEYGKW